MILKKLLLILICVIAIISASFGIHTVVENLYRQQSNLKFIQESANLENLLQNRIDIYTSVLYSAQAFIASSEMVSRDEFNSYFKLTDLFNRYPGISAVSYIERVKNEDLQSFIEEVRTDKTLFSSGFPSFDVITDQQKDTYYIIKYTEPFDATRAIFGLDIASNPERFETLLKARDSGSPSVTGRVQLIAPETGEEGFLIYIPVYKRGAPLINSEDRENAAFVYLSGIFSINTLLKAVFPSSEIYKDIQIEIYDGDSSNREEDKLYSTNILPHGTTDFFEIDGKISIADKNWDIIFKTNTKFGLNDFEKSTPIISAVITIILGILISILIYSLVNSRTRAISLARNMTQKLKDSQQNLETLVSGVSVILFSVDKNGIFTLSEGKGLSAIGRKPGELVGKSVFEVYKDQTEIINDIKRALKGEEFTSVRKIGNTIYESFYNPIIINEKIEGITSVSVDVTDRENYQKDLLERTNELERLNKVMVDRELKMVELKNELKKLKNI